MSWINNYTETLSPNNKTKFIFEDKTDSIIVGASCQHVFEVPFLFTNYVKKAEVIYKQGLDTILEIELGIDNIIEKGANKTTIIIRLTPEQTILFRETVLDTFVQLKIVTTSDNIIYDDPHYISVSEPLFIDRLLDKEEEEIEND